MNEDERIARIKQAAAIKERPPSPGHIKDETGNWRMTIPEGYYHNQHGELVLIPDEHDMDRGR
jgi:hypothetical protein